MKSLRSCLFALLLFLSLQAASQNEFITEWSINESPYNVRIPVIGSGYTVNWVKADDPSINGTIINGVSGHTITLPSTGNFRISVTPGSGIVVGINSRTYPASFTGMNRLIYVRQWGNIQWQSLKEAFYQCWNMEVTALDTPNLTSVTDLSYMFYDCNKFTGNNSFNLWNTSTIVNMSNLFTSTKFNGSIGDWNTSNVTNMTSMFKNAYDFNQDIGNWSTEKVTNMSEMFSGANKFNQNISNWNTGAVTNMSSMFYMCGAFNAPIGNWDTHNVTTFSSMFLAAKNFNQPIGNWITTNLTSMDFMFWGAINFNQPLNNWSTSNVTDLAAMFYNASAFNQPLNNWNTSKVKSMSLMFQDASSFNQSLGSWNLSGLIINPPALWTGMDNMLNGSGMDCTNYSSTLIGWANSPNTPSAVLLNATGLFYNSSAQAAHSYLTNTKGWTINGDFYFATCGASLPVEFSNISATSKNGSLSIHWSTLSEKNNDYFSIEASIDGKNFKSIATIKSKANNGNSDTSIQYNWEGGLNTTTALLGSISLGFLLLGCIKKKRKLTYSILAVMLFSGMIASCSKSGDSFDTNYNGDLYIRVKQVDKDGKAEVSKSIKVIHQ